jgi:geranylgeranyl pyrophosphate synthase
MTSLPHGDNGGTPPWQWRDPRVASPDGPLMELSPVHRRQLDTVLGDVVDGLPGQLGVPCSRIVHAAGRRLRPALTIACADVRSEQPLSMQVAVGAASVELLHCATLVHDDVIDEASTRRGVPTINAAEGLSTAIVAGDALIAAAMSLATQAGREAVALMASTLAALCAGQAAEEALRFDTNATAQQILAVAQAKTGSLLKAACVLGAQASTHDADVSRRLGEYGAAFGICLQLTDDVLDVVSCETILGKPIGADICTGVMSLPIITCAATHREIGPLLGSRHGTRQHNEALRLLRDSDAVPATITAARAQADTAAVAVGATIQTKPNLVTHLADWPVRYVETQLRDKVHPAFRTLIPPSQIPATRAS